ncbi:hypothetical protein [Rhizohabitans arisaemae]|uniref:hypothetical protein n=1 Tax=Rhizohabitans arisaemae TaxID=2720610 RepID=UPI0024B16B88|nr:hypothetical protein [Rhizohabitans arisaemae]
MTTLLRLGAVALLACSAACGSGQADPGGADGETELLNLGKELAQCLRQNGIPDFPDPLVKDGKLVMPSRPAGQDTTFDRALKSCDSVARKLDQSGAGDRFSDADVAKLRAFARCIRENGVPEWPDPKSDGSFPILNTPLDGKTERLQRALEPCRKHWNKGWRVS